jgi:hypothetical protein
MTSFLFAVEPVQYPIDDCHRRKLFIGKCIGLVALKRSKEFSVLPSSRFFSNMEWCFFFCIILLFTFCALLYNCYNVSHQNAHTSL